jgi:hypothetical protein
VGTRVITILVDYNLEGYRDQLYGALLAAGWADLAPIRLVTFSQVGLPPDSSDREVWRCAQSNGWLLLTSNRNMKGADSLEQTLREENHSEALPVLTIGNTAHLTQRAYRERCLSRMVEIALDLEEHRGHGRIFVP